MSLATNVSDLATRAGSEDKKLRTLINGNAVDLSALTTTAKANLVAALNEVKNVADSAAGGGVAIDDVTASTTTVFSSTRTQTEIDDRIETRLDVSTADLDTFREVADALADNDSAVATINTQLTNRVRHDAAQTIADGGTQARTNIGAASATDLGTVVDGAPVTAFEAALI